MQTVARPLYTQVREALLARMADGEWSAGTALPSEQALAAQMGVSQGTVRKALDDMARDNLVDRRQGRGTFVPEHTQARALFHFFRLQGPDGDALVPELLSQSHDLVAPDAEVAAQLGSGRRKLWQITRLRAIAGTPAIVEHVFLDPKRMPGLTARTELPNALYGFYQSAAQATIARADDRLSALSAPAAVAAQLGLPADAPVLFAARTAYDLRDGVVEVRRSWFRTTECRYTVTLR